MTRSEAEAEIARLRKENEELRRRLAWHWVEWGYLHRKAFGW